MKTPEKIFTTQTLIGENVDDKVVCIYLNLANQKILDRLYPYDNTKTVDDIPERYDLISCELASRLYLRRGAEGEIAHNENGINRTYDSVDDSDILDKILPFARV